MSPVKMPDSGTPATVAVMPVEFSAYVERAAKLDQEQFVRRFTDPFLVLARTERLVDAIREEAKRSFSVDSTAVAAVSIAETPLAYVCPIRPRPGGSKSAPVSLGRSLDNDIVLPVASISAVQLQFKAPTKADGPWSARDMGSKNGTFLDGLRMIPGQHYELTSGAQLDIARDVSGSFWEPDELWRLARDPSRLQELLSTRTPPTTDDW